MAHNFQGYDGYFILQYLYKNGVVPEVIMRGAKLLTIYVPMIKIKFIDALCFIPMKLANFPKTFRIAELAKGIFHICLTEQRIRRILDQYLQAHITNLTE